jgi:phosphoketolase
VHVLEEQDLRRVDAYWRAANYLSVGQIYLLDNPLLREPLRPEHIKPRLLGHWGTSPGLNFIYVHLNRIIKSRDLNVIYICGPGHGGPAMVANTYLEGTYSEIYPEVTQDVAGMRRLFRQFSFPGGVPSHAAPETPGSIHEGGELGYSLAHAYGAAFDNPDLIVACVVGDGEAETGPLAASWHCNAFLNPVSDGAVLPILHLNGYKIANPTMLGRLPDEQVVELFRAYGYEPLLAAGSDPNLMHRRMAEVLEQAFDEIGIIQARARRGSNNDTGAAVPPWPLVILRSAKGWTGPKEVDGKKVEGSWRAHQIPIPAVRENPAHLRQLEQWMRSYRPEELFDQSGRLMQDIAELAPNGNRRMGLNPHANGGLVRRELRLPDFHAYAVTVASPGAPQAEATRIVGAFLRDVMKLNATNRNFRLVGPDETSSNRLDAVFEATDRVWMERLEPYDVHLSRDGHVMEVLSEHLCEGWLEGYLLTGRHGLFSCYEACLRTYDRINVIVAGKQPAPQWLTMNEAVRHCHAGIGSWNWASNDEDGREPDVVMACAGDVPTLEAIAAVGLLRQHLPDLRIRVVKVVDLMTLESKSAHPHGISDAEFDGLFTQTRPVIFAYHGYPQLIHRLTYNRKNHDNIHVRGYIEEGTTTTPFDMVVLNKLDRFHLAIEVIERVPGLVSRAAHARQLFRDKLLEHKRYIDQYGEDMPEIQGWSWPYESAKGRPRLRRRA